jgi:hypothetical protein
VVPQEPAAGGHRARPGDSGRSLGDSGDPDRCHSGSLGRAGHHLYRVLRPGAAGGRGPGHLPDHLQDAGGALRQGRARLLLLRLLLRLRDLRRRHRSLLGALPGSGVSVGTVARPSPGGVAAARPRCHRRGLGLHVRAQLGSAIVGRPAQPAGLVSEVRSVIRRRRLRGGLDRRLRPPVPGGSRPGAVAGLRPAAAEGEHGDSALEHRSRGAVRAASRSSSRTSPT